MQPVTHESGEKVTPAVAIVKVTVSPVSRSSSKKPRSASTSAPSRPLTPAWKVSTGIPGSRRATTASPTVAKDGNWVTQTACETAVPIGLPATRTVALVMTPPPVVATALKVSSRATPEAATVTLPASRLPSVLVQTVPVTWKSAPTAGASRT